jgi:beta-glucosidase
MIYKKNISSVISLIFTTTLAISATISKPLELPVQIKQASISVRQHALFAKVMAKALWKYAKNDIEHHTIIEEKLAIIYGPAFLPTQETIHNDVEALYAAIENNSSITIAPEQFLIGASSSAIQIEGGLDATSAASRFYKEKAHLPTAGDAIDFYNRYESDIEQLAQELNINAYRISVAWNRIEPEMGIFDQEAIEFYRNVIQSLLKRGIKPMVVFHHYDAPTWFEDCGGFELQKNGRLFQEFCLTVYTALAQELGECLISMCNAPEGPAFKGYFTGDGTPGEKGNLQKTHTVIANMYYELVDTALHIQETYTLLKKANPTLKKPSIGTQINVVPLDPHASAMNNWKDKLKTTLGCAMAGYIQSGGTYNFLVNGEYLIFTPNANFMKQAKNVNVYRHHNQAHKAFDWIGVNIYSNRFLNGFEQITGDKLIEEDEERYTDNANYRNYPEGIYRAVQMISDNVAVPLGKLRNKNGKPLPIIVTENGIATKDDGKRTRYFQRAIWTITQLIKDGYPVIGYLPWTSHDNYEWPTQDNPEGFNSKCYGFFAVNLDKNSPDYLTRTLKEGSRYYANFAKTFFAQA